MIIDRNQTKLLINNIKTLNYSGLIDDNIKKRRKFRRFLIFRVKPIIF